jgi:hypothetical protein
MDQSSSENIRNAISAGPGYPTNIVRTALLSPSFSQHDTPSFHLVLRTLGGPSGVPCSKI